MLCVKEQNLKTCPCTYPRCDKKGKCCECLKFHLVNQELPACCFNKNTEKTFDRSFNRFIIDHQ